MPLLENERLCDLPRAYSQHQKCHSSAIMPAGYPVGTNDLPRPPPPPHPTTARRRYTHNDAPARDRPYSKATHTPVLPSSIHTDAVERSHVSVSSVRTRVARFRESGHGQVSANAVADNVVTSQADLARLGELSKLVRWVGGRGVFLN